MNVRSENGNSPRPQPLFLRQENSETSVDFNEVVVTNQLSGNDRIDNPQIQLFGGTMTVQTSSIAGKVETIGARWTQIASDVGSLQNLSGGKATLVTSRVAGNVTVANSSYVGLNSEIDGSIFSVGTSQIMELPG